MNREASYQMTDEGDVGKQKVKKTIIQKKISKLNWTKEHPKKSLSLLEGFNIYFFTKIAITYKGLDI